MIQLLHTCAQGHAWPVRCDFSEDGLLYPDPTATVCKVCWTIGGALHQQAIAYRICPNCLEHYGIALAQTSYGMTLPEQFPMLCMTCGRSSGKNDPYGLGGIVTLPIWAFLQKTQQIPMFSDPGEIHE